MGADRGRVEEGPPDRGGRAFHPDGRAGHADVRYVSVEGPVTRTIPETDELLREITERYLPPEKVPAYLEFAKAELGAQVAIYLRPQRWLSSDLGPS